MAERQVLLLVEDDAPLRRSLVLLLDDEGFDALEAGSGTEGVAQLDRSPDAVLLDLGLPDVDGIELCRRLRAGTPVPIVVLTGERGDGQVGRALHAGADEFLRKPVPSDELAQRLRALLSPPEPGPWGVPELELDLARHGVVRDDRLVRLSRTELRLLVALAAHPGRVVAHDALLEGLWGLPSVAGIAALHARARSLQAGLADAVRIAAHDGGYRLDRRSPH